MVVGKMVCLQPGRRFPASVATRRRRCLLIIGSQHSRPTLDTANVCKSRALRSDMLTSDEVYLVRVLAAGEVMCNEEVGEI